MHSWLYDTMNGIIRVNAKYSANQHKEEAFLSKSCCKFVRWHSHNCDGVRMCRLPWLNRTFDWNCVCFFPQIRFARLWNSIEFIWFCSSSPSHLQLHLFVLYAFFSSSSFTFFFFCLQIVSFGFELVAWFLGGFVLSSGMFATVLASHITAVNEEYSVGKQKYHLNWF